MKSPFKTSFSDTKTSLWFTLTHIIFTFFCIAIIIFLPKIFLDKSTRSKRGLVLVIISLLLINQGMDLYREGYMDEWKLGLPLHLCDFSTASIILYFFTQRKEFFLFAFFAGFSSIFPEKNIFRFVLNGMQMQIPSELLPLLWPGHHSTFRDCIGFQLKSFTSMDRVGFHFPTKKGQMISLFDLF